LGLFGSGSQYGSRGGGGKEMAAVHG
jgi:hypothetical protein